MNPNKLSKRIFDFFRNRKTKPNWFKETEKDLAELKISENSLINRTAQLITKDENIRFQDKSDTKIKTHHFGRSGRVKKSWVLRK